MTQIRAQHHTPLVWVASPEVFPRSFPFFFQFSSGQSGVGNFAAGILLGALATQDPWTNNPSTNQRNHGSTSWTGTAVWFLGLGSYGPGLVFPCSDAAACNGWLKIYMQSAEDVIKERLQVEGQVKADVGLTTNFFPSAWCFENACALSTCDDYILVSESSHGGCKCIHRILRRF